MATYVMNSSELSKLEKRKFIAEVEKRRALWDKRLSKHKNRQLLKCLWTEVADIMNWDVEICKKTWKNLFDQFRHNYNHAIRSKAHNEGIDDVNAAIASVKWSFFNQLLFLRELIAKRRSMHAWTDSNFSYFTDFGRTDEQIHNILYTLHEDEKSNITNTHVSTETLVYEECLSYPDGSESSSSPMPLVQEALEAPPVSEAPLCRPSIHSMACTTTTDASTGTTYTEPSVSGLTGRPQKRQRTDDGAEEVFRSFEEQMNSMEQVIHSTIRPDSASIFGAYVTDLLRDVPADSRRRCELSVLQLMHSYLH